MNYKYLIAAFAGALLTSVCFLLASEQNDQSATTAHTKLLNHPDSNLANAEPATSSLSPTTSALVDKNTLMRENQELREALDELQQKVDHYEEMRQAIRQTHTRIKAHKNMRQSIEAKIADKEWSNEEVAKVYAKPFSDFVKSTQGIYREKLHEFQFEPINEEWAFDLETKIRDFIQLNEFAQLVEISVLNCKTYRCQLGLLVQEPKSKPWKRIFDQMTLEPWFQFHTHYSAPILNDSSAVIANFFFMEGLPPKN